MSKPIVLQKVGSKWEVWLDVPAARAYVPRRVVDKLAKYDGEGLVPVVRTPDKKLDLLAGGKAERFSKEDAKHVAHMIGRYKLELGDFVHTYVEERREAASQGSRDACKLGGIAKKRGLRRSDFNPRSLAVGRKIEMEHTGDWRTAERIAMDHLAEDPKYYQKLLRYVERR